MIQYLSYIRFKEVITLIKKILAVFLLLTIISATFCSCKPFWAGIESELSFVDTVLIEEEYWIYESVTEETSESTSNNKTNNNSSITKNSSSNIEPETPPTTAKPTVPISVDVQVEETIITDEEIAEQITFDSINEIDFNNNHNPLNESNYYQYSSLNEKEKKLYNSIVNTIAQSGTVVNTSKLSVSYDDIVSVFQKVLTDYPQYFYISRSCMLAYGSRGNNIRAILLLYTDGNVTDSYDENMNLLQSADRNLINQKINALQSAVEEIVSQIPTEASDIIKEKIIHDYIIETVKYDYDTAENVNNYTASIPHAFDIYGAAVDGLAVCEGYSKLFQYLCYSVGINSTQVIGTSGGGNHMWNAVLIDNEWYQIDITWNDTEPIIGYSYFNLTEKNISEDHIIDFSTLSVPQCNAEANSFINIFAVCITNLTEAPTNYETAIANLKKTEDKMLNIYFVNSELEKGGNINTQKYVRYIQQHMFKKSSDFYTYLSSQGIAMLNTIQKNNEFIVLTLKY